MFRANPEPKDLIPELDALAAAATSARELMTGIVGLLHKNLLKYNWVGFYMIEKEPAEDMLVLGKGWRFLAKPFVSSQLTELVVDLAGS